jgi:hypothetical protein
MDKKELLIELCDNLQKELNQREGKQTHKVELQSGLKPESYFTPTRTLPEGVRRTWFVEVWVDGKCIFREAHVPHETEALEIVEGLLISRLLRRIFTFGVMSSKKFIDEREENKHNVGRWPH